MTIGIGTLTGSGVVLATDTKYSTGTIVNYGEKVFPLPLRDNYRVVVAGAGDAGFIRSAAQKIDAALPARGANMTALTRIVEAANKSCFEEHVIPHGSDTVPCELLVAVGMKDGSIELLKTSTNSTESVPNYALIGTGGVTAQPYVGIWREDMNDFTAELMAAFIVKYAKTYDENSGGDTRIFTLLGKDLFKLEAPYLASAENYFEEFNRLTLDLLLPLEIIDMDSVYYRDEIDKVLRWSTEYRKNLIRSRAEALVPVP